MLSRSPDERRNALPDFRICPRTSISLVIALIGLLLSATGMRAQTETILYSFSGGADGRNPAVSLVIDAQGNLYGTTAGTVFKLTSFGSLETLYAFTGGADGGSPQTTNLILDSLGNLYGTTTDGGNTGCNASDGCGVVFKLAPSGVETVLYTFSGGADGGSPWAGVVQDSDGNLYGTTEIGGAYNYGTVFKLTPSGTETVLYSFSGGTDGAFPLDGLTFDAEGNLYGTTYEGGILQNGTVFQVTPAGSETILYSFGGSCSQQEGCPDGRLPRAGVVFDSAGNLYGTTVFGSGKGKRCGKGDDGCGVAFKLSPSHTISEIWKFTGPNGMEPYAGLVFDTDGNLYGTSSAGGASLIGGTVFEIPKKKQARKVLYSFCPLGGRCTDGFSPYGGVIFDTKGNLYGTTLLGGAYGYGTIFKLTP
jgi:uncharacterized repeat protein (TIGR03803 family)